MGTIKDLNFDLKQLRSFLEVLKQNSFTRASRKLRIGQATISHHIRELEETLGVVLIKRTSKEISITGQGRVFQELCEKLFADIDAFTAGLGPDAPAGITKIAASTIPSTYLLPKMLAVVKKEYPDIRYKIQAADSREAVEIVKEGGADIGIVGEQFRHPALVFTRFFRDEIVLIGPCGYPDRIAVQELSRQPFIIREPGSGTRNAYEQALAARGVLPSSLKVVMECSATEGIKESVAAGIGVSFISSLAAGRGNRDRAFKVIEVGGLAIKRDFYIVHAKKKLLSRTMKLLVDYLIVTGKRYDKLKA